MSILPSLIAVAGFLVPQAQDAPVSLGRVFVKNQKLAYEVRSSLHAEVKMRGLQTALPEDVDLNYDFTTIVEDLKADGIAIVHYQRPVIHQIDGETFDSPPKDNVEKINLDYRLTVSPINEILEAKDLNEKPAKTPKKGGSGLVLTRLGGKQVSLQQMVGQFASEMYRLSLFAGSFDSALDFDPKTPFDPVKVGETWKRTVGYQPQKLKGKGDKQAVQRLDYTYTYKGIVDSDGKKVYRVEAVLNLNTDLADFINQLVNMKPDETGLKKVPMTMKSTIEFDLDMKTKNTILAQAKSETTFSVFITAYPDDPVEEQTSKGHSTMRLAGDRIITPAKKG